jgi:hypothetical protein
MTEVMHCLPKVQNPEFKAHECHPRKKIKLNPYFISLTKLKLTTDLNLRVKTVKY